MTAETAACVVQLAYAGLTGRAPDVDGASFWADQPDVASVIYPMASTPEAASFRVWSPEGLELLVDLVELECSAGTPAPAGWADAGHGVHLPPILLDIRWCESRDDYTAANAQSSARGAFQFLRGSWEWYGHADRYGVPTADLATPAQQDEAALLTWQQDGTSPWNASRGCWA